MHILSANQFNKELLIKLFERADYFKTQELNGEARRRLALTYNGRQVCTLFYQPSTRTRLSFETAATKLGIGVISTENAREASSAAKGETLEDTIRILGGYNLDVIIMRHFEKGAARRAAKVSNVPIINAGDGPGEHPTQALLDAHTIFSHHGRLDGLKVVIGGDLKHGRTMRSLSIILSKFKNNSITFVSVPELQVREDTKKLLSKSGTKFKETDNMQQAFKDADVVYWTRIQKEYISEPDKLPKGAFTITKKSLKTMPKKAIIMHPLPRVDEIEVEVDNDPRAYYFKQASNGMYIRMALLEHILENGR
jgi:aspartate carbamoyltransferase catalytic subunit